MTLTPDVQILHLSVDEDGSESHFRILVDSKHIKYLTIDAGVFETDDMCFPPKLLSQLPSLPQGDWNLGHIAMNETDDKPWFDWVVKKTFSSIKNPWHPTRVDYLSLKLSEQYMANVYEVRCERFDLPLIAKFARFPYETSWYNVETEAYSWIAGHDIGPGFLGHITEGDRIIGFLLEKIEGRHANTDDLEICRRAVQRLHDLGIVHGDLNRHNFLVRKSEAVLIDFENARKTDDVEEMRKEMAGIEQQLRDTSKRGWKTLYRDG